MAVASPHQPAATIAAGRHYIALADQARALQTLGSKRRLQVALGLIWLFNGVLQFQPFMFTRSFVTEIVAPNTADQPGFVAWPIRLAEHLIEPRVAFFNAFAATLQILIGLGLLYRPTVRIALLGSVGWALSVWWIGEGLGGLFTGSASPLTDAPGAAVLYVFASLILWPRPVGGLLGRRGALVAWTILWLGSAALWLLPVNRAADGVHDQIADAPSGAGWLSSIESSAANAASGHGLAIAIVAAALSVAVGLASLRDRSAGLSLILAVLLGLGYFVVGQGLGGIFTGSGTDPGTGPLFVLLALALYAIRPPRPIAGVPTRRGGIARRERRAVEPRTSTH
jgi:hypothetical protein